MVRSLQRLAIHGYKNFQMIFFQKLISLKQHIPTSIDGQQVKVTNGYLNFQFSQKPLFSEDKLDKKTGSFFSMEKNMGHQMEKLSLFLKEKDWRPMHKQTLSLHQTAQAKTTLETKSRDLQQPILRYILAVVSYNKSCYTLGR